MLTTIIKRWLRKPFTTITKSPLNQICVVHKICITYIKPSHTTYNSIIRIMVSKIQIPPMAIKIKQIHRNYLDLINTIKINFKKKRMMAFKKNINIQKVQRPQENNPQISLIMKGFLVIVLEIIFVSNFKATHLAIFASTSMERSVMALRRKELI